MQKIRPWLGIILSLMLIALCITPQAQSLLKLPPYKRLVVGETGTIYLHLPESLKDRIEMQLVNPAQSVFALPQDPPITISANSSGYEIIALRPGKVNVKLKLLGYIPIKSMALETLPTRRVVAGGHSIGVILQSKGVMVVGYAPVTDGTGKKVCPAREQGVEIGDVIYQLNDRPLHSEGELAELIDKDEIVTLGIKRGDKKISIRVQGAYCPETNRCRVGLYVRDGVIGVGTLTYWEPDSKVFAALGHVIVDADTKQQIDVLRGELLVLPFRGLNRVKQGNRAKK